MNTNQPRRIKQRQRVRMRSGKVATISGDFIADCLLFDRSENGVRLRLNQSVDIPEHIKLYDDELNKLRTGTVIWQLENELGVLFADGDANIETSGEIHARLSGKYYAIDKG